MDKNQVKEKLKKVWNFIWHDNSIWSWIVNIILAFIIVKWIFFPVLGLIFSTSLPLVLIESDSMHHSGNFNAWWQEMNKWYLDDGMNETTVKNWNWNNGMDKGDIIILKGTSNINIGDVVVFNANQAHPIIHRVIFINQTTIETKGDNNYLQLDIEKNVPRSNIIGKAIFRIPKLGWVKLFFVQLFSKNQ